jgi:hypothetical protein
MTPFIPSLKHRRSWHGITPPPYTPPFFLTFFLNIDFQKKIFIIYIYILMY